MKKILSLTVSISLLASCSSINIGENKGKDAEFQILDPNLRVEKFKETFNIKAEGPVTLDCSGKPCTPDQVSALTPDQIKKLKRNGEWKEYVEKEGTGPDKKKFSVLVRVGTYKDDKRDGIWKTLFETGETLRETPYVAGVKEGEDKKLTKDGTQTESTLYKADKKNGPYWSKTDKGILTEEGTYTDDKKTGTWKEYYNEDGAKKTVGDYRDGKKNGKESNYYKDGNTLSSEGSYSDDLKVGYWKNYYDNGGVLSEGGYTPKGSGDDKKSLRSGAWKEYYKNGKVFAEGQRDHTRKGDWKFYWSNGNPAYKGAMMNEMMMSSAEVYDKDGQLIGKGKLLFDLLLMDDKTDELKAKFKPDLPFTYYKNGKKTFEILSETTAIEYDDSGAKIGQGPVMPGTNAKNDCWTTSQGKKYYVNGRENAKMGELQGCK
ncbi:LIC20035 family adhesin [Leptospira langatensis]|uniref:LIC20035 family adhesin n=1 Tax=Leptospira langatensis TaxID=2484983 RepID=A0A5F1ZS36_9LEPT|nr:LIC20035 family adhesin [Leptospira langatensis]TGK01960.1 LIC20035 family adhesin [Leptospira langatensis]TGL39317.1 LIC20035 family adhesin [Leptospira langatensis]